MDSAAFPGGRSASINPEDYQTYIFVPSFRLRTTYEVSVSCYVNTARNII